MLGAILLYCLAGVGAYFAVKYLAAPWKYVISAVPVLPAMYFAILVSRSFQEMDELQRRIQLEALAFGFSASAVLTLGYGFLQHAGLRIENWIWVWPVMGVCFIIGKLLAQRRYR